MSTIEHTQSLNDFRRLLGETLDRVNQTGDAEIIVDQGEAREVLLSPAVYDAMRDAAAIQRSRQDIAEGKVHSIDLVSAHIRAGLLARKSSQTEPSEAIAGSHHRHRWGSDPGVG